MKFTGRRDDGSPIMLRNNQTDAIRKFETFTGNLLNFYKIDRKSMGAYLCIAANDVPPAVSKRVFLNVQCEILIFLLPRNFTQKFKFFPVAPNVTTPNYLFGAFERSNVEVECYVESSPRPVSYWIKETVAKSFQNEKPKQKMLQQR